MPVQCPWTSRELYQAKFELLNLLRSWGTDFGRDEGMWYDVRIVMDLMDMRIPELLSIVKLCPDETQVTLPVRPGVGQETMIAREAQHRVFQEIDTLQHAEFCEGLGNRHRMGWSAAGGENQRYQTSMEEKGACAGLACYIGTSDL